MTEERKINCAALRTCHEIERLLRRHIEALMDMACDDLEASEAITNAIGHAELALQDMRAAEKRALGRS